MLGDHNRDLPQKCIQILVRLTVKRISTTDLIFFRIAELKVQSRQPLTSTFSLC